MITTQVTKTLTSRVEDGRGSMKPRFPSSLIKPDMRSYRIRLSDWLHHKAHGRRHFSLDASRMHQMPPRLRLTVKLSLESQNLMGVCRHKANHHFSFPSKARQKQGSFPPPALPGITGNMTLSDSRPDRHTIVSLRVATPHSGRVSHVAQVTFLTCCPHYPGGSA